MWNIEEIFSVKEIGEILKIKPTAVRNLIEDGNLKANNVSRGSIRPVWKITETQLKEYLETNNIKYERGDLGE